jgi:hypothetical protein
MCPALPERRIANQAIVKQRAQHVQTRFVDPNHNKCDIAEFFAEYSQCIFVRFALTIARPTLLKIPQRRENRREVWCHPIEKVLTCLCKCGRVTYPVDKPEKLLEMGRQCDDGPLKRNFVKNACTSGMVT